MNPMLRKILGVVGSVLLVVLVWVLCLLWASPL